MFNQITKKSWFTLIELLIVITIIWVLTALAANFIWDQAWAKSRDTIRISDVNQIATIASSLQNRFHTPPLVSSNGWKKYPTECISWKLMKCFQVLKVANDEALTEMFSDPKQWVAIWSKKFQYYYWSTADWFKVCTHMEDQWAFDKINANEDWKLWVQLTPWKDTAFMYCVTHWSDINDKPVQVIEIN